jgi:hypothetical protein
LVEIIEEDCVVMKLVAPSSIKLTIEVAHLNPEYHKAFEVFRAGDATMPEIPDSNAGRRVGICTPDPYRVMRF